MLELSFTKDSAPHSGVIKKLSNVGTFSFLSFLYFLDLFGTIDSVDLRTLFQQGCCFVLLVLFDFCGACWIFSTLFGTIGRVDLKT